MGTASLRTAFAVAVLIIMVGSTWGANVWWESAVIYQIYPRSFKDSNGDGVGDLNGIKQKLSYLKETGVDAIWLSPIYLSPMKDFGYDITDYTAIDPIFGTMNDFDSLMAAAKRLGIRIVLDYVPNHTSDVSEWFIKSARRESPYEDYYIWADGKPDPNNAGQTLPPNNWVSTFRKSAWQYHPGRGQYYLHQFVIGQPDLNYRNAGVQREMKDVLRFWLNKGVSGFRVDAINMMYEVDPQLHNGKYPDEPLSGNIGTGPDDYEYLNHIYTKDQDETYEVAYDWRELLDEYETKDKEAKVMMTESYAEMDLVMRYYGNGVRNGSVPFNFFFLDHLNDQSNAQDFKNNIDSWMSSMPRGKVANWVNGNHDQSRVGTRQGVDRIDAMNMLALILPGIALTYQGEEIGMTDGSISWEETKDPQACNTDDPVNYWRKSRDPARTPFQWDNSTHAGFSTTTGKTWLPVASNYKQVNLAAQINTKSHYTFYKDVVAIKKRPAVRSGTLDTKALSTDILVVTRVLSGHPTITSVVNLSNQPKTVNLASVAQIPDQLKVIASGVRCCLNKGVEVSSKNVDVSANCAIVFEGVPPSPPPPPPTEAPVVNGGFRPFLFTVPFYLYWSIILLNYY